MDKIIRGEKISYWENNAKENYNKTPISVLKYITILEEALNDSNKVASSQLVVGQIEQLHKLLQHLSDEDELTHNRTHQQIIDDFKKLV